MFELAHPPLPPDMPETNLECVVNASAYYSLPPELLLSIRIHENGRVGQSIGNTNATRDHGPVQVNDVHKETFESFGISMDQIRNDECTNMFAGAYLLRVALNGRPNDFWRGVGDYHSKTPKFNLRYRGHVSKVLARLQQKHSDLIHYLRMRVMAARQTLLSNQAHFSVSEPEGE